MFELCGSIEKENDFWWKYSHKMKKFSIPRETEEGFTEKEAKIIGDQLIKKVLFYEPKMPYVMVEVGKTKFYVNVNWEDGIVYLPFDEDGNHIRTLDKNLFYDA